MDRPGPRPTEPRKRGPTSSGEPQPTAAEVESARLLSNEARDALAADGLDEDEIRRLADEFIARHLGEGTPEFVAWARARSRTRK